MSDWEREQVERSRREVNARLAKRFERQSFFKLKVLLSYVLCGALGAFLWELFVWSVGSFK